MIKGSCVSVRGLLNAVQLQTLAVQTTIRTLVTLDLS
jgi:hypothetical protein